MKKFDVQTPSKEVFVDITGQVEEEVRKAGFKAGVCVVYVPHTTAAVTINENADPSVRQDILMALPGPCRTASPTRIQRATRRPTSSQAWWALRSPSRSRTASSSWARGRGYFSANSTAPAAARSTSFGPLCPYPCVSHCL